MNTYDVTYITDPINEDLEEQLLDDPTLDLNIGSHSGVHFAMTTVAADDFQLAATELATRLEDRGIRVLRMDLDLVNQSEIATRAGVSRQAVSNWVNSSGLVHQFPSPHTLVGGPAWAWSQVNEWLRRTCKKTYDDACSASPEQVDAFNTAWRKRAKVETQSVAYDELSVIVSGRTTLMQHVETGLSTVRSGSIHA